MLEAINPNLSLREDARRIRSFFDNLCKDLDYRDNTDNTRSIVKADGT